MYLLQACVCCKNDGGQSGLAPSPGPSLEGGESTKHSHRLKRSPLGPGVFRGCYTVPMKTLAVNGESKQTDAATIEQLLVELGLAGQAVAVEVNRDVVPKKRHGLTELSDGDRVELVTLVGGG